ncbi:MAG TPA: SHOCT domain-containing protein [Actinopolymorphaceae bacterium]|jgi:uncharacterized membrane protein
MQQFLASYAAEWGQWAHGGWWPLFPILWAVFWAAVILTGAYLFTRYGRRGRQRSSAEAVLAERYARGEIDEEEYRVRLAVLKESRV